LYAQYRRSPPGFESSRTLIAAQAKENQVRNLYQEFQTIHRLAAAHEGKLRLPLRVYFKVGSVEVDLIKADAD
jgi:hypothetical protein